MRSNPAYATPPVTLNLLIINILVFVASQIPSLHEAVYRYLVLYLPASPHFRVWQPLTHMFVHADLSHLFFNMFALWMFGRVVEYDLGSKRFLLYYFVCGLGAALLQTVVFYMQLHGLIAAGDPAVDYASMAGASGAVFGILLAFGMMRPNAMIMLIIPPIPMKAKYFVIVYGVIELLFGIRGGDSVAHFAHLGGMLWGFLLILWWKHRARQRRQRWQS